MTDVVSQKVDAARLLLRRIARDFAPAAFASSLGAEDMVLTDLIFTDALPIEAFTLDTGRLPDETYALIDTIADRYGARLRVLFPRAEAVESHVKSHGVNLAAESRAPLRPAVPARQGASLSSTSRATTP